MPRVHAMTLSHRRDLRRYAEGKTPRERALAYTGRCALKAIRRHGEKPATKSCIVEKIRMLDALRQ